MVVLLAANQIVVIVEKTPIEFVALHVVPLKQITRPSQR
jgi:hypothetical protein